MAANSIASYQMTSLDIVEAAYADVDDTEAWLRRLTQLAATFDLGQGVVGYVQSADPNLATPHFVAIGRDDYPALLTALQVAAPPSWHEHFGRAMVASGSFRGFLGALGESPDELSRILRPFGVYDVLGVRAQDGRGWAVGFTSFADSPIEASRSNLERWTRVATHLGTSLRLRLRLAGDAPPAPDAVLSPDGRLLDAATREAARGRERLRVGVRDVDRARGSLRRTDPDAALSLWEGLLAGRWSLLDRVDTDGRRFVLAYANGVNVAGAWPLSERELAIVRWVVGGAANKEVAYALGLSVGTVGWHLTNAMFKLRVRNRVELIALWRESTRVPAADGHNVRILPLDQVEIPAALASLPAAEREVALLAAEGNDNKTIAELRGTSAHTVANLLRRVYHRLQLQSRSELAVLLSLPPSPTRGAREDPQ
jgi:DNA-binding CsgD family transcriptional regulator